MKSYLLTIANEEADPAAAGGNQNPASPETGVLTVEEKLSAVRNSKGILPLPAGFDLKEFIAEEKSKDYASS